MGEAAQRQPWERWTTEGIRAYAAFCAYRNLGPQRTLTNAVRGYLSGKANKTATKQQRQQKRWKAHLTPGKYLRNVRRRWGDWSRKNAWVERCAAYDEHQEYELRHAELRAESAAVERKAAERVLQRELLTQEAVGIRTIARLLAGQILAVLKDPRQLAEMKLRRVKVVDGDKFNRTEMTTPGILDLVKLVGDGLKIGSELYRVAQLDQPGDDGKPKTAERKAQELANILAGKLLGMDIGGLLALREELIGLDGKPGEAR